jgi:YHS domain-containing protein
LNNVRAGLVTFLRTAYLCTTSQNDYFLGMKNSEHDSVILKSEQVGGEPSGRRTSERVLDPVCGMLVQPDSPHRTTYGGEYFVLCSPHCLETFQRDPERYLEGTKPVGGQS